MVSVETTMMMTFCPVMNVPPPADDLVAVGRVERVRDRPEPGSIAFSSMIETPMVAISGSSSLPRSRSGAKIAGVHQPAERGADRQRDADADEVIAAEQVHEEVGGERAERDDVGMREVDLDQDAVDQREPQAPPGHRGFPRTMPLIACWRTTVSHGAGRPLQFQSAPSRTGPAMVSM